MKPHFQTVLRQRATPLVVMLIVCLTSIQTTSANDGLISGQWRGRWNSCNTGHQGRMSAQFCRIDQTHVQANFRGTFAKVIPFRYRPVLDIVHEQPGMMVLAGSKKLPIVGTFQYNATITPNQFDATYRSKRDHGYWRMSR